MPPNELPVAIIGGGPAGLAAAAHLIERGEAAILFEAGASVGANVRDWGHVRMFSPWEFNVDSASVRLLESAGWRMPPADELPTGLELVERYLQPLAELPAMRAIIRTGTRVIGLSRRNHDKVKDGERELAPFQLHAVNDGHEELVEARAVIDASGAWHLPNPLGANGRPAIGEASLRERLVYGIPDILGDERSRFAGKRVIVVGSGHSAINVLLDLMRLREDHPQTDIIWVMRSRNLRKVYGGGEDDALAARGQLGLRIKAAVAAGALRIAAPFPPTHVSLGGDQLLLRSEFNGDAGSLSADEIIICAGARPELELLREMRLDLDPAVEATRSLAPLIDPNLHSCGTVRPHGEAELRQPEADFYIVGMKSYGRAPTFLLATGYEQARSVVAALCGDWEAARDVRLNLPETGVCVTDFADEGACCVPAEVAQPALLALGEIPIVSEIPVDRARERVPCC
ncbi:MAG: NAD(P)-binding domain-containing protein [Chloroflexota bacterium]|nr:NAD(P)-binding domain-containing protein [Chloroflexota bacterium]MDE2947408.1 NAD(P)-binding domain-containing protein [Chloroflexota bacterium]